MGDKTEIGWTDATWNPVTGCSKVSPGCANCYAETMAMTRLAGRKGYPGLPWTPENAAANVMLRPDRLSQPFTWRKPRMIFVNSMSDLFHELVPEGFIRETFDVMRRCTWNGGADAGRLGDGHTFQVLTKRPERMAAIVSRLRWDPDAGLTLDGPGRQYTDRQVWLGTSIENDRHAFRADHLRATPAGIRFISAEPLLGPLPSLDLTGIDWLIIGGESGTGWREMDTQWAIELAERAHDEGVAVFVKQDSGRRAGGQGILPDRIWAMKEYPR